MTLIHYNESIWYEDSAVPRCRLEYDRVTGVVYVYPQILQLGEDEHKAVIEVCWEVHPHCDKVKIMEVDE